jgi:hypothetical protein
VIPQIVVCSGNIYFCAPTFDFRDENMLNFIWGNKMKKYTLSLIFLAFITTLANCGGSEMRTRSGTLLNGIDDVYDVPGDVDEPEPHLSSSEMTYLNTPAAGACTLNDRRNYIYPSNSAFSKKWEECGRGASGAADGTTTCLRGAYPGLSAACASCFGAYVGCSRSNCWWDCGFEHTPNEN